MPISRDRVIWFFRAKAMALVISGILVRMATKTSPTKASVKPVLPTSGVMVLTRNLDSKPASIVIKKRRIMAPRPVQRSWFSSGACLSTTKHMAMCDQGVNKTEDIDNS